MRQRNWRAIIGGSIVLGFTVAFALVMLALASRSTDPAALMATVGMTAGVVGGLSLLVVMHGLVGTKIREGRWATRAMPSARPLFRP